MADRYLTFTRTAPGRFLTRRLGLPRPVPLRRFSPEHPALDGPLLHLTAGDLPLPGLHEVLTRTGLPPHTGPLGTRHPAAVVLDATGVATVSALVDVHATLHPVVRSIADCGRVVVLGAPLSPADHHQAAAQQALDGFVRSLAKELGRGRTATLVRTASAPATEPTLRFLLSPKSAYVNGQTIEVTPDAHAPENDSPGRPLAGRTALVTGAARGIGAAVAEVLARDGARVVALDVPAARTDLVRVAERVGGAPLALDITADDAGERIAAALPGGLDVLVHNAGITRDRRLANMAADRWSSVLDVNLGSVLRTTDFLLKSGTLRRGGSVVATASVAGLAGNAGQTNYAASKAGVAGLVRSLAPRALAEHGITVNAVAPGFIETRMTAAVPLLIREAGRRLNSLAQGGQPVDVAETVAWLALGGVNAQVIRVCGQSLLGA
ncbi:3-oxoacyl-ACP reductase [Streptomyces spectabilis]|uniref:3-oxoacyl-ACP reductase n=1 Tax=Streptomyces spectabilis TaxID=68270 RepID=A0A5P2XCN9_STRST|nr:3-oxoacyl-ACP reductase [Streptomyces spectabilis]MBB5108115.1 3-oxoacyl-[acyl-carrier protein] reductase [Streptomyces spectabilis]MCI3904338.1 3-oxoacyl-ACP reductase [Streptomyces spectabilis]QEV61444.1 3-oxoacyl-ACP reductase [Streptomyces spectabilis]GGV26618.1 3-oxoacyl-ACP reductase [Streptomyces spectabilis]